MTAGTISFFTGEDPLRASKLNAAFAERLLLAGDTMAGPLILSRPPVLPFEAATKGYIDNLLTVKLLLTVSDTPPGSVVPNTLWWHSAECQLYIYYDDGTSKQWVPASTLSALNSYAPLNSPVFTGDARAVTPAPGDNDTSIATTAFVAAAVAMSGTVNPSNANPAINGTAAAGTSVLYSRGDHVHPTDTSRAPIASPTFTGTVRAPIIAATGALTLAGTSVSTVDQLPVLATTSVVGLVKPDGITITVDGTGKIKAVGGGVSGGSSVTISDTAPSTPLPGDQWWCSADGNLYIRYNDGNSDQWVVAVNVPAPGAAPGVASFNSRIGPVTLTSADVNPFVPGRNLLHNSMFNIAQRGAGPFTVSATFTADRWIVDATSDAISWTIAPLSDGARTQIGDESAISGLQNSFTGNAAAGAFNAVHHRIESVRRLGGKTVTISFWAVASAALKLGINMAQVFGSGGGPSAPLWVLGTGLSVTLGTTWARYSVTVALPSVAGKTLGTASNDYTQLTFACSSGATGNATYGNVGVQSGSIALWGVQLEIGNVATALEKPDPQQDLAKCQRFYQAAQGTWGGYLAVGANTGYLPLPLPVTMRATPTVVFTPTGGGNYSTMSATANINTISIGITATTTATTNFAYSYTASADL